MLSRVADNLYWMGRYLERAEHTARLIDVHLNLMLDRAPGLVEQQRLVRLLEVTLRLQPGHYNLDDGDGILYRLTFDTSEPASIVANIATARENAQYVREQISSEMWTQINQVYLNNREAQALPIWRNSPHEYYLESARGQPFVPGHYRCNHEPRPGLVLYPDWPLYGAYHQAARPAGSAYGRR